MQGRAPFGLPRFAPGNLLLTYRSGNQQARTRLSRGPFLTLSNLLGCQKRLAPHRSSVRKSHALRFLPTQIWHLVASLQEYCAANAGDLDPQLADVRKKIAAGEIESPLWVESQRKQARERPLSPCM
ncbi:hypothetical protein SBC1_78950 (plasmid) [Caballeronia sp. SBC1]|nr:hypothetical protein SBC1_78950 [Caballeronia sp. SBC1]